MTHSFQYDAMRSQSILAQWVGMPDSVTTWVGGGSDVAQGAMGALVSAEALAVASGAIAPNSPIGAAEHSGDWTKAPAGAQQLYYATQYWARRTGMFAKKTTLPDGMHGADGMGQISLGVALLVVGVAAVIAAAWYATVTRAVAIYATHARNIAKLDALNKLATTYVAAGKPVPPALWQQLGNVGTKSTSSSRYLLPVAAGVALLGALGVVAYAAHEGGARPRLPNPWWGQPRRHRRAAQEGWDRRYEGVEGYAAPDAPYGIQG